MNVMHCFWTCNISILVVAFAGHVSSDVIWWFISLYLVVTFVGHI
jgi:hypothetical protein